MMSTLTRCLFVYSPAVFVTSCGAGGREDGREHREDLPVSSIHIEINMEGNLRSLHGMSRELISNSLISLHPLQQFFHRPQACTGAPGSGQ